jgi:6,7-dimethyl-8-ribityllumazine synthase
MATKATKRATSRQGRSGAETGDAGPGGTSFARARASSGAMSVVVVSSAYNATVTGALERGAVEAFGESAVPEALGLVLERYHVSGSFELVPAVAEAVGHERVVAVVALGCIIKGETAHDVVLGHAVTGQLAALSASSGVPVGLGVLTVNTQAQALARAGLALRGKSIVAAQPKPGELAAPGNKGAEAMRAVLDALVTQIAIAQGESSPWMLAELGETNSPDKLRKASAGKASAGKASLGKASLGKAGAQ